MQNYWENLTLGKNIREKVYNISEIAECRKVTYLVSTVLTHFYPMYIFYIFFQFHALGFLVLLGGIK